MGSVAQGTDFPPTPELQTTAIPVYKQMENRQAYQGRAPKGARSEPVWVLVTVSTAHRFDLQVFVLKPKLNHLT